MAQHLARIHGTEEDRINCPFYFKIGACRHEDRCSRLHHKPAFSPTLLIKHLYRNPNRNGAANANITPQVAQEEFFCFYEDLFMEISKFGHIDEMHVVDNLGDHLVGHVYVKLDNEEEAADVLDKMMGRFYDGIPIVAEYSPVTDFREARCRDFDEQTCTRGGFCNFLHVKPVPYCLFASLQEDAHEMRQEQQKVEEEERAQRKKRKREKKKGKKSAKSSKRGRHHDDNDSDDASISSGHYGS